MRPKHILIVDDEPALALGLVEALKQSGQPYQASAVHSGEEALAQLDRLPQDLLITDLCMPGIDGLALIRWVRTFYPCMPTILVTAATDEAVELKARAAGAWDLITKPFDLQVFLDAVDTVLHSPREVT